MSAERRNQLILGTLSRVAGAMEAALEMVDGCDDEAGLGFSGGASLVAVRCYCIAGLLERGELVEGIYGESLPGLAGQILMVMEGLEDVARKIVDADDECLQADAAAETVRLARSELRMVMRSVATKGGD